MDNIEGESSPQDVGTQPTDYQEEVIFTQPTEFEEVTEPDAPVVSLVCAEDPSKSFDVKYEKGKSVTLGSSEESHIRMAGEFISRAMGTFESKNSGMYFKIQGQNGGRLERAGASTVLLPAASVVEAAASKVKAKSEVMLQQGDIMTFGNGKNLNVSVNKFVVNTNGIVFPGRHLKSNKMSAPSAGGAQGAPAELIGKATEFAAKLKETTSERGARVILKAFIDSAKEIMGEKPEDVARKQAQEVRDEELKHLKAAQDQKAKDRIGAQFRRKFSGKGNGKLKNKGNSKGEGRRQRFR